MIFKFILATSLLVGSLAQNDYLDTPLRVPSPNRRPAPARIDPEYSGPVAPRPTPVPILKQINKHNEDGSYTYGYESADGSFKIETKLPNGEVKGKYGYLDDTGKVRVVEYGATKYGFAPSGEGITVPPPTLVDETTNKDGTLNEEYADNLYEPEPAPRDKFQNYPQNYPVLQARDPAPQTYRPAPQAYQPAPQTFQSRPRPQPIAQQEPESNFGPVPSRPSIPGASLSIDFGTPSRAAPIPLRPRPQTFSFQPEVAPVEEDNYEPAPAPAPRPQQAVFSRPRPQPAFQPEQEPIRPAPRPSVGGRLNGPGILDQLAKDYALPSGGGAPLHDISFGYY